MRHLRRVSAVSKEDFHANARAAIRKLGDEAAFTVPLGVLGPFSQWLEFPDWLLDGTTLQKHGGLPQRISMANDITVTANFLDRGFGPFLIRKTLETSRLITGPTASMIIRNAPTLEDALVNLAALINATNMNVSLAFQRDDDRAGVTIEPKLPIGAMLHFVAAIRLVLAIRTLERFLLRDLEAVHLRLSLPFDAEIHELLGTLATDVEMGAQSNGVSFPVDWLGIANPDYDASFWHIACQRLRSVEGATDDRNLAIRLKREVSRTLSAEKRVPRLKEVAVTEGVTVRTLGRKLASTGIKFQDIVDRERRQLIEELLSDPAIGLAEIARATGYATTSSFGRAFLHWYGTTPGRFRASLIEPSPGR